MLKFCVRSGLIVIAILVVACAPAASPTPTAAPAKPPEAAKPAAKATEAPAAKAPLSKAEGPAAKASPAAKPAEQPAAKASPVAKPALKGDPAEWERAKAEAKREGAVVVAGPGVPALRSGISDGFQKAHGIPVEYVGLSSGEMQARVEQEQRAGRPSIDVHIGGTTTCWNMSERGYIDPITPQLVDPSILNPSVWRDGAPLLLAPLPSQPRDFNCAAQIAEWVNVDLMVNTQQVQPDAIKSWKDLLKPEYKGKITAFDPRTSGPGQTPAAYLFVLFGEQYFRDLYVGQQVVLSRDGRQLAESVGRGVHPFGIGLVPPDIERLREQGLPLQRVFPTDGPGSVTAGFGTVMKLKGSPHPNATKVFINWYLTKEGQDVHEAGMLEPSLRTDVARKAPDYVVPRRGVTYSNNSDPDYFFNKRVPANQKIPEILGR